MMKKTGIALALLLLPGLAMADDAAKKNNGVGLRLGTGGIGLDYTYGLNRWVDLRAGYSFGSYSGEYDEDGIEYDAKLKISAATLMADIKPFAGGFRITAGLYSGSPEMEINARSADTTEIFEIGDREFRGDDLALDGGIDLGSTAPYLGLGWGGTTNGSGFGVSFDLGVMFTKSPDVGLVASGTVCDATADPNCDPSVAGPNTFDVSDPRFQAQLDEEVGNLEKDAEDFKMWPVISLGLHYRF